MENIKFCQNCGAKIDKNDKICPDCGKTIKPPIYKQWWFWMIISFIFIIIAGSAVSNTGKKTVSNTNDNAATYEVKNETIDNFSIEIPENWLRKDKEDGFVYFYTPESDFLLVKKTTMSEELDDFFFDTYLEGFTEIMSDIKNIDKKTIEINNKKFYMAEICAVLYESLQSCHLYTTSQNGNLYSFAMYCKGEEFKYNSEFQKILSSFEINTVPQIDIEQETEIDDETNTDAEIEINDEYKNEKNSEEENNVSLGKKNALKQAKSYLESMSFSKSGLIEQLEYEGYTNEEAIYAVERCEADWNQQAAKTAQSYIDSMAFSRNGLIEQLEYEGFTHEQAVYGVNAVGY